MTSSADMNQQFNMPSVHFLNNKNELHKNKLQDNDSTCMARERGRLNKIRGDTFMECLTWRPR